MSDTIQKLIETIKSRKNQDINKSYTSALLDGGLKKCIDKMEEEFIELKDALKDNNNVIYESADLIYHLLVTLESAGIDYNDVLKELEKRKNKSGFEEKKSR